MKEISVKECISFGWSTFKAQGRFLVGVSAILFLVSILASIPQTLTDTTKGWDTYELVGILISAALSFLISKGKTNFYLRAYDAPARLSNLWSPRQYLSFVAASILSAAVTIIGLILLIIPGVIIGLALCFTAYIVIDKKVGPIAAMKESIRLTKGNRWNLLLLGVLILLINLLGALALFIGLLITLPITSLAIVHAYRTVAGPAIGSVDPVEESEESHVLATSGTAATTL